MSEPKRVGTIEVDQDLDHARSLWRVQRIGWLLMLLLIVGGVLGLFGNGPLAEDRAQAGALTFDYDRFARHGALSELRAEVGPRALQSDTLKLWMTRSYLEAVELESIVPEPESVETRGDLVVFQFATAERSQPTQITFSVRPARYWSHGARAGIDGGGSVSFRQFIYP
ncbi:MAG TPA: hypothetical protein VJ650_04755 [Gemmatimonadaceae bacterium]|nr:hypothetical protein [Gemmatimonadaceae bacterium]